MSEAVTKIINGLGNTVDSGRRLPVIQLEQQVYARALDCVHCGLCLPACPTYTTNGLEADSPRGRIMLMKGLADGTTDATPSVVKHLDLCLDCRACETACPSGVVYHELIEAVRPQLDSQRPRTLRDRLIMAMVRHVFAYPTRMKMAMMPARLLQRLGLWRLVAALPMAQLLPPVSASATLPPGTYASATPRQSRVGFFTGCVGNVLFSQVNRQAVELLQHAGCDVVVPPDQACCGAIHHHSGDSQTARAFARRNTEAFAGVDFVVTAVAGCGAMMQEYPHLLGHVGSQLTVKDISVALDELGMPRPRHALQLTVAYHDACHLAHAQRIVDPPRNLLGMIDGLTLAPLPESDMCCGAAGTYNLTQPAMARSLGERKIRHILRTGAAACVTGNAGCALQIAATARRMGVDLELIHPVSLLHRAVFGPPCL